MSKSFFASIFGQNTQEELAAKAKFMADSKLKALGGALLNRLDEEKNRLAKPGEVKATDTGTFSTIFRIPSSATEQNEASATIDKFLTKAKGASNDKALTTYINGLPLELQANLYKKELGAIFSEETKRNLLAANGGVEEIATILAADPAHADNLKQATDIMTKTAAVSDKMTLSNIAVCFAPNLLNPTTMQTMESAPSVLVDIVAAQSSALAQDPVAKMRAAAAAFVVDNRSSTGASLYSSPQDALVNNLYEKPVPLSPELLAAEEKAAREEGIYVTQGQMRGGPSKERKTSPVAPNLSDTASVVSNDSGFGGSGVSQQAVRPPIPAPRNLSVSPTKEVDSAVVSNASKPSGMPPIPAPRAPRRTPSDIVAEGPQGGIGSFAERVAAAANARKDKDNVGPLR